MEKKNNATNTVLVAVNAADGRTLARLLLLSLVRSDALCEQLAANTITRWAERSFAAEPMAVVLRALNDGALRPLFVMDTLLHAPRLLLLGASAPVLDLTLFFETAAPVDFCAVLFVIAKRHARYAAHVGSMGHVWDASAIFSDDDVLLKASRMLGTIVAGKIGARMGFEQGRWNVLCARVRPPPTSGQWRAELKRAYDDAMVSVPCEDLVAAPPKKKKKLSQRKAAANQ